MGKLRKLLVPFSILYGAITFVRNKLFDWGVNSTYKIPVKSITVGNLSVGGTGKTPHVAFLAAFLSKTKKTTILSRGYGRKTKGYFQVNSTSTATMVGDEPLQYFTELAPEVSVVVCESRTQGVQKIISEIQPDIILLDDAFQHRKVKAGYSILLMDYNKPFYKDCMLPTGDLREYTSGKKRADRLIVTKCPVDLSIETKKNICLKTGFLDAHVYFSNIVYGNVLNFDNQVFKSFGCVLLITGIANPFPLYNHLKETNKVELVTFPDHHAFSVMDIQKIHTKFDLLEDPNAVILTTEKDFMRLKSIVTKNELERYPWCYIPIKISLDREEEFVQEIINYVNTI
jgi:tetraacyldisaccharide 4'-kinase